MQRRSEAPSLAWRIQRLLQIDALNLVILIVAVYVLWSLTSALIANPEISLGLQSLPTASLALLGAGLYFLIRSR